VTTCLRHADGGDVELTVRVVNGVFRVDVARRGGERAVRIDDDGFLDETGVGMEILNALAERWGIERGHGEWRAWFELAAATAAPPPTPDR
jgi:hypothetical protein